MQSEIYKELCKGKKKYVMTNNFVSKTHWALQRFSETQCIRVQK